MASGCMHRLPTGMQTTCDWAVLVCRVNIIREIQCSSSQCHVLTSLSLSHPPYIHHTDSEVEYRNLLRMRIAEEVRGRGREMGGGIAVTIIVA